MAGEKILIIDPSPDDVRPLVEEVLQPGGYTVVRALDAQDGLRRALDESPDLVFAEATTVDPSRSDVLKRLRRGGQETPFIITGVSDTPQTYKWALREGAVDYLLKPLDLTEARSAMSRALAKQGASPASSDDQQLEEQLRELTILHDLGKALGTVRDPEKLLNRIVEAGVYLTEAEEGFLLLMDKETNQLYMRAGQDMGKRFSTGFRVKSTHRLFWQVVETGEPILINPDAGDEQVQVKTGYLVNALLYVPLKVVDEVIGVLSVNNRTTDQGFSEGHQRLLAGLADYAAIAVYNMQQHDQALAQALTEQPAAPSPSFEREDTASLEKQVRELNILHDLGKAVSSVRDFDKLLRRIVEAAIYLTGAEEGFLLLKDEDTGELCMRASQGPGKQFATGFRVKSADSLVLQVMETGEPVLIGNTPDDEAIKIQTGYLVQSLLHVPLLLGGEAIGVLSVDNRSSRQSLTENDLRLLSTLAEYAAIAVDNVQQYERAEAEAAKLGQQLAVQESPPPPTLEQEEAAAEAPLLGEQPAALDLPPPPAPEQVGTAAEARPLGEQPAAQEPVPPPSPKPAETTAEAQPLGEQLAVPESPAPPPPEPAEPAAEAQPLREQLVVPESPPLPAPTPAETAAEARPLGEQPAAQEPAPPPPPEQAETAAEAEAFTLSEEPAAQVSQPPPAPEQARAAPQPEQEALSQLVKELKAQQLLAEQRVRETGQLARELAAQISAAGEPAMDQQDLRDEAEDVARRLAAAEEEAGGPSPEAQAGTLTDFGETLDRLREGFAVTDRQGFITSANNTAEQLLEFESLVGQDLYSLDSSENWTASVDRMLEGDQQPDSAWQDVTFWSKGRLIRAIFLPVSEDAPGGWAVIFRNVFRGRPADLAVEDLAASVSEKFRTPMTILSSYTDILLEGSAGDLAPAQQDLLRRMRENLATIRGFLDEPATLSPVAVDEREIKAEGVHTSTDLNVVIQETVAHAGPWLDKKQQLVKVSMIGDLPNVAAQPNSVHQMIFNLLRNAAGATPVGGTISLIAEAGSGDDPADRRPYVTVSVHDQGGGIAPEFRGFVFERVRSQEEQPIPGLGGKGAELTAAKTLVEASGGRIWMDTEMGEGSTFHALLPASADLPVS